MTKEITELSLSVTEAEVKKAVADYLQYGENQGKWLFMRLNAGSFILTDKDSNFRRRVQGVKKGTSDFVIFQSVKHTLCYGRQPFTECEPMSACRVTFIECKSTKGKTSKEQDDFAGQVRQIHCGYFVIRNVDELEKAIA